MRYFVKERSSFPGQYFVWDDHLHQVVRHSKHREVCQRFADKMNLLAEKVQAKRWAHR